MKEEKSWSIRTIVNKLVELLAVMNCVLAFRAVLGGHLCIVPLRGARWNHWDDVYNRAGPLCLFGKGNV